MISTNDFKTGITIEYNGEVYTVVDFQHVKPGKGSAFVRTRLKNVKTGAVLERTFDAGEKLPRAHVERRECQYLYNTGNEYIVMDSQTFEQIPLTAAEIGRESEACAARSAAGMKPVKGRLRFSPSKPPRGGCLVTLYVDGRAVSASSRYPYSCEWDSASGPNGLHSVEIECSQVSGNQSVESQLVLVRNQTSSGSGRG